MHRLLIVDDDLLIREFLTEGLETDYRVDAARNGKEANRLIRNSSYHIALLDLRLPDANGLEILKQIKSFDQRTAVIVMTAHSSVETAVEAMKLGAFHYIKKPFTINEITLLLEKALEFDDLRRENARLRREVEKKFDFCNIIGQSRVMQDIFEVIETVAASTATVLIEGDTGTGKELISKAIHFNSDRRSRSFIKVNCAALPSELLESELFGHEKGAFTGADKRIIGKFELADSGTLLLDEIGEIARPLQAKLLRVLQEKEFYRVGGTQLVKADTRVIATTNRNLRKALKNGEFREDLYYRLNVVPVFIPPLRDRKEDIPILVGRFLDKFNKQNGKNVHIEPEVVQYFLRLKWAGNVRELENCIERAVVMARAQTLSLSNFLIQEEEISGPDSRSAVPSVGDTIREMEKRLILETLSSVNGNRTRASEMLGVSIRTIRNKLKEYKSYSAEQSQSV